MKRLGKNEANKLLKKILNTGGAVAYTRHALEEMAKDKMTTVDVENVLRGGRIYEEPEFVREGYRYRVHTEMFGVVVEFRSEKEALVVTAWRKKR